MRKYLLPEKGRFYKANLHCHSTISDGKWTPEEIKENYKARGYSVVAYTDHSVFLTHNDLTDKDFIALNGYELDVTESKPWSTSPRTCHTCFISIDKDKTEQRLYYNNKFLEAQRDKVNIPEGVTNFHREYNHEFISWLMEKGREEGFFVTYNHPVWSLEADGAYMNYHGMHAMEIVNFSSCSLGHQDHNSVIYGNMLKNTKGLYCIAADDNHDRYPIGHPKHDSFGAFTMIKAESLDYNTIAKALLDGSFYASEGPEIHELYVEDGTIHIKTSDVARISMISESRFHQRATAEHIGETINEASFTLSDDAPVGEYVRFILRDLQGKEAYTNAYYVDEFTAENEA